MTKLCLLLALVPIQWPLLIWQCFPAGDRIHSPAIHGLQRVLPSLGVTQEALGTRTRGVFSRKAAPCLCFDPSRSFGWGRNKQLLGIPSEGFTVGVRRSLDWGTLRFSSWGFCLLPFLLGERHQQNEPRIFILNFQTQAGHF